MNSLNYRHLYYFWMVAKEGSMARAAQRLDMAIQTISVQVRELEKSLGHQLQLLDEYAHSLFQSVKVETQGNSCF